MYVVLENSREGRSNLRARRIELTGLASIQGGRAGQPAIVAADGLVAVVQ